MFLPAQVTWDFINLSCPLQPNPLSKSETPAYTPWKLSVAHPSARIRLMWPGNSLDGGSDTPITQRVQARWSRRELGWLSRFRKPQDKFSWQVWDRGGGKGHSIGHSVPKEYHRVPQIFNYWQVERWRGRCLDGGETSFVRVPGVGLYSERPMPRLWVRRNNII